MSTKHEPSCADAPAARGPFHVRRLVSLCLVVMFVATALSGVVLLLAPGHGAGRGVAVIWGWRVQQWAAFHAATTLGLVLTSVVHVAFNARTLLCYAKPLSARTNARRRLPVSWELVVAVPLCALIVAAAVWVVPPSGGVGPGRGRGRAHHAGRAPSAQSVSERVRRVSTAGVSRATRAPAQAGRVVRAGSTARRGRGAGGRQASRGGVAGCPWRR